MKWGPRELNQLSVGQLAIGAGCALLLAVVQRLTWHHFSYHHLILQTPAILLSLLLGRGVWSAVSAIITGVALWILYFHRLVHAEPTFSAADWLDLAAFVLSGAGITILLGRLLPQVVDRADELERLRYAVLAAKVGIWEWDVIKDYSLWNDQMFQLFGITPGSVRVTSRVWKAAIHPEDRERVWGEVQRALKHLGTFETQFRIVRPDGTIRRLQASALVRRGTGGESEAMYGMSRDISEEVETMERLQEINAYFEAAMNQSSVGVVIAEAPSGAFRFCNQAALAIREGGRSQLVESVGMGDYGHWQLVTLDGRPIANEETPLSRSFLHGETIRTEIGMLNERGEMKIVLVNAAPIRRSDGSIMAGIAVFIDNTESHRLMDQLANAKRAAEVASNAKSRFLDIAAHELRTPVTAVSLLLQVAQKQLTAGKPVESGALDRLQSQVDRLSRLVVDLLEVSQLDRGMLILKVEKADITQVISDCVSYFRLQDPSRKIILQGELTGTEAEIDSVRIYEVISNLLDNAVKYTPHESTIEVIVEDSPTRIRILVRDHGPGIPPERLALLFHPFERGVSREQEEHAGLGLGLYICRKIMELHQGSISGVSELGVGSTFIIEFPRFTSVIGAPSVVA